jgi:crotonobetainyl-CoA hydratase
MPSEFILTSAECGVLTITLNRPAKMNALLPEMHMALDEAFDTFAADDALQVCVVRGAGERAFCAGSDLGAFNSEGGNPYPATGYAGIAQRWDLAKPVIAAVNGVCLGGGFELALSCDLIVASQTAVFGLPEPKVGLIAIGGGIHRLVQQTGLKQAMGPLLTGANISAQEGLAPEALDAAVAELCRQILACAPLAVQLTKQLAMWGCDQPTLADALEGQVEQPAFRRWMRSEDAREGPKAFAEKRPPEWKGR